MTIRAGAISICFSMKKVSPAQFMAFDLLYLDGHDLTKTELRVRRHLLEELIGDQEAAIRFSKAFEATGEQFFRAAREHGLEGIVAKHLYRPYRSGRRGDWIKVKCTASDSSSSSATSDRGQAASDRSCWARIAVTKWSTSGASGLASNTGRRSSG